MNRGSVRWLVCTAMVAVLLLVAGCGGSGDQVGADAGGRVESGTGDLTRETEAEPVAALAELEEAAKETNLPIVAREDVDGDVTGEITGFVDGEPFQVYTMISDLEEFDEPLNSTSWSPMGFKNNVVIIAYREKQTDRRGAVMFQLEFDEDWAFIEEESYFTYFESPFDVFMAEYGTVQVTSVERSDDDMLAVNGTFGGDASESFDETTKKEVTEGTFSVKHIPMVIWW